MFNNIDSIREKIKEDKPFAGFINIVHIENLFPDTKLKVISVHGGAFKIQDSEGGFYKLRMVSSIDLMIPPIDLAERYERRVKLVPHIFPKFYGRDRNYLLFEFLDGRTLAGNESLDIFFEIGAMCGTVNKFKLDKNAKVPLPAERYNLAMKLICERQIVSLEDYRRIEKAYGKLTKKTGYEVTLEMVDLAEANLMLTDQNRLYFVDEGAMTYHMKGHCVAPALLYWFNQERKNAFFKGYDSVNSSRFYTQDYEKLVVFHFLVEIIGYNLNLGKEYKHYLSWLLERID